jgi:putative ABC transport system permease protein
LGILLAYAFVSPVAKVMEQKAEAESRAYMAISPEVSTSAQALANGRNWSTTIFGSSPEYLMIRDWKLISGSMFSDREVRGSLPVAVIGSKTALELFGPIDPIGKSVRINNIPFTIIGALESKGAGMGGQNQDDRLIIPYTTAMKRITGDRYLRSVNIRVGSSERMDSAQEEITALLRQRHGLSTEESNDFDIFNQKDVADTVSSVTGVVKLLLGAISSLSLIVGGIGIMNIMLVSVTERTREIGIRMAVGARPGAIQLQFLIEAVTLSIPGGIMGIILGVATSKFVGMVSTFEAIVTTDSIILAFGVSFAIGVFFGYYPARKAAALDPIDALRYE